MQALQVMDAEVFNPMTAQGEVDRATHRQVVVLPEGPSRRKGLIQALIRLLAAVLGAILRGLRAIWVSSIRASEAYNRQFQTLDPRYPGVYGLR